MSDGAKSRSRTDAKAREAARRPALAARGSGGAKVAAADAGGGSPAYRRARRDRGEETRTQLLEAGLDVFGRYGFEGATTRQIAQAAGVNLAAIVYHFGGKEALYLAVAEHVANTVAGRIGPVAASLPEPKTPEEAVGMICRLLETMVDLLVGNDEARRWAPFILREQLTPTAAFDTIYRFMGGTADIAVGLVARATGRAPDDEIVQLKVVTLLGQALVFRIANAFVLRRTGWDDIGDREIALIKRTLIANARAILTPEATP